MRNNTRLALLNHGKMMIDELTRVRSSKARSVRLIRSIYIKLQWQILEKYLE